MPECGCINECCKGCSCCLAKNAIIQDKDLELENKNTEIFDLKNQLIIERAGRTVAIGGDIDAIELKRKLEKAEDDLIRIREQRNQYYNEKDYFKNLAERFDQDRAKIAELVEELTETVDKLKGEMKTIKKENQELKQKTSNIQSVIIQTPKLNKE